MRTIIISGTYAEAMAYIQRKGLDRREVCIGVPAPGLHYDRLALVGSWFKMWNIRREIQFALNLVNPNTHKISQADATGEPYSPKDVW